VLHKITFKNYFKIIAKKDEARNLTIFVEAAWL